MEPHDGPDNDDREQPHLAAGDEPVAAALAELGTIGQRPLAEHPDAFARVHGGLQQALSDIDDA